MVCNKCRKETPDDSLFCENCGAKVIKTFNKLPVFRWIFLVGTIIILIVCNIVFSTMNQAITANEFKDMIGSFYTKVENVKYSEYTNKKFGFSVKIPDFLTVKNESFTHEDATFCTYRKDIYVFLQVYQHDYDLKNVSIASIYKNEIKEMPDDIRGNTGKDWIEYEYTLEDENAENKCYYVKEYYGSDGMCISLSIHYPEFMSRDLNKKYGFEENYKAIEIIKQSFKHDEDIQNDADTEKNSWKNLCWNTYECEENGTFIWWEINKGKYTMKSETVGEVHGYYGVFEDYSVVNDNELCYYDGDDYTKIRVLFLDKDIMIIETENESMISGTYKRYKF